MSGTQATIPQDPANAEGVSENKGKGKAPAEDVPQDTAMNDDDDDDDSSSDEEEEEQAAQGDDGEDGLEEIDLNNIVEGGRRTRGQIIDFAKAAEQNPVDDDDEDDDDDDFTPPDEDTKMSG
ncbi:Histone H2A.Z-specific chaperone CHZ1 [Amphichorda felina]